MFEIIFSSWLVTVLFLAWVIAILATEENGLFGVGILLTVFVVTMHDWLYDPNISTFCIDHAVAALLAFAAYLIAGLAWSFYRWWRKVLYQKELWLEAIDRVAADWEREQRFPLDISRSPSGRGTKEKAIEKLAPKESFRPKPDYSQIACWIVFWPWSVFWYLTSDLLVRFAQAIRRHFGKLYQGIVDRAFG